MGNVACGIEEFYKKRSTDPDSKDVKTGLSLGPNLKYNDRS